MDEQDVKSVLVRQKGKLDTKHLEKRAKQTQIQTTLEAIQKL